MPFHAPVVRHIFVLLVIVAVVPGCGVGPVRESTVVLRRHASTITVMLNGQPTLLRNARISSFTLSDGTPSWTLGADGPDGHGTMEITFLKSAVENATTYFLDNRPASESALLVVRSKKGLRAYSLDDSRPSAVIIESVSDRRVTGRFALTLTGTSGRRNAQLVCGHFDVPLIEERTSWW
jgi:hypothetical protein